MLPEHELAGTRDLGYEYFLSKTDNNKLTSFKSLSKCHWPKLAGIQASND